MDKKGKLSLNCHKILLLNNSPGNLCISYEGERSERVGDLDRDRERESIFRIRDRRRLDTTLRDEALKSLERDKVEGFTTDSIKKNQNPLANPLLFGEDLQYWTEKVQI